MIQRDQSQLEPGLVETSRSVAISAVIAFHAHFNPCPLWVNRAILTVRRPVEPAPDKRTISEPIGTSQKCSIATYASQQTVTLFDHLVGPGKQCRWHCEAERFGGLEIDRQLETCQGWRGQFFGLIIAEAINAATAAEYSSNPLKLKCISPFQ
jgi:hypothetical protein